MIIKSEIAVSLARRTNFTRSVHLRLGFNAGGEKGSGLLAYSLYKLGASVLEVFFFFLSIILNLNFKCNVDHYKNKP